MTAAGGIKESELQRFIEATQRAKEKWNDVEAVPATPATCPFAPLY